MGTLVLEIAFGFAALMIILLVLSLALSCGLYAVAAILAVVTAPLRFVAWLIRSHSTACSAPRYTR